MKKVNDAEYPIMNFIWNNEPTTATSIATFAQQELGWKKNTTYTVIKRLCDRKILLRADEPNIIITTLVSRQEVEHEQSDDFLNKMYNGSLKMFLVSFMNGKPMSDKKMKKLQKLVDELEE